MKKNDPTMAREIAEAVRAFELQREGFVVNSITVILCDRTLAITLDGALTSIEQSLLQSAGGVAQVQEYHQRLFTTPPLLLWEQIKRIIRADAKHAGVEQTPLTCVKVFPNGSVVHVFLLPHAVPTSVWNETLAQPAVAAMAG